MLTIFRCKLRELKEDESNWLILIDKLYQQRAVTEDKTLARWTIDRFQRYLEDCQRQLKRFSWLAKLSSGIVQKSELDIVRAKEFPIGDIITTKKTGSSGGRDYYICNQHIEKTGSLVVYKKDNSWHCFGSCATGGDSIDMVMKLNNMDFVSAVKFLT